MLRLDGMNVPPQIKSVTINGGHFSYINEKGENITIEDWPSRMKILNAIENLEAAIKECEMKNVRHFIVHEGTGTFIALEECKIVEIEEDTENPVIIEDLQDLEKITRKNAPATDLRPPMAWINRCSHGGVFRGETCPKCNERVV
jgi:hypothetical protein